MEAKFEKQTYGAVVATILETENSIVEVQERNDGVYGLIVHHRAEDRDNWDDLTAYLKPEHFDALGSVARRMRGSAVNAYGQPTDLERELTAALRHLLYQPMNSNAHRKADAVLTKATERGL